MTKKSNEISCASLMDKLDKLDQINENISKLSDIPDTWHNATYHFVLNEIYRLRSDLNTLRSTVDKIKMNAPGLTR